MTKGGKSHTKHIATEMLKKVKPGGWEETEYQVTPMDVTINCRLLYKEQLNKRTCFGSEVLWENKVEKSMTSL